MCLTDSRMLPPLYEMDDYLECTQDPYNKYCNIEAQLDRSSLSEYLNEFIENSDRNPWTFDKRVLHRALCIPNHKNQNLLDIYRHSSIVINEKIKSYNISAQIDTAVCTKVHPEINTYDALYLVLVISYALFVTFGTIYGKKFRQEKGIKLIISKLSLIHTWKQRTKIPDNIDYQKLLSMQGIRLFSISLIVIIHLILGYNFSYILNPAEYEKIFSLSLIRAVSFLAIFVVLNFFLISSWLLCVQVYNIFEEHGKLSIVNIGILIVNRYFRLVSTVAVIMLTIPTSWMIQFTGPSNFAAIVESQQACKDNWLFSLMLISNFNYLFNICNPVTWYISADFQLYVANILVIYIYFKLRLNGLKYYLSLLLGAVLLHALYLYNYGADNIYTPSLRNLEMRNFGKSSSIVVSYMSTSSIWPSSLIGIIMAHIYYGIRNTYIRKSKIIIYLWSMAFFGLPAIALYLSSIIPNGYAPIILGSIVRPLYTLGVAVGILGMSQNIGGALRKWLKAKYVVFLSNFTYCVYLTHFGIIIILNRYTYSPLYVNFFRMVQDGIIVLILSFVFGIFVTLVIEEPGIMLQKAYLPQISKWRKSSHEAKNTELKKLNK
ncbi:O-acyltransferase like protein isoform X2 [Diabrotica virgifera virgifera]|uniref:O-acyltransferase like protein-like isoform X2 n=1 Tax=Diabrotica virgifera virgifera TaxID=50390 RepID=A0A6P7GDV5_DIAVI|nr:O-acyltransferase like protein isoform X2 [Diabrotica virgifera virgifera]